MKFFRYLIICCCALLSAQLVQAQTVPPQAFNYSAVARDANGSTIANTTLGIQISIRQSNPEGAVVFQENHTVETDNFGVFNLAVGMGSSVSGSIEGVQWGADEYYLEVGMDVEGDTDFQVMGITQMLSVPYALFAGSAGGIGLGGGPVALPNIAAPTISDITSNGALFSSTISNVAEDDIIERGFVYATEPNVNVTDPTVNFDIGIGDFEAPVGLDRLGEQGFWNGLLESGTQYYVKAYARTLNNLYFYSDEVSFTTLSIGQTGEAGGIVFFDKGNDDGGWQYLEAKPTNQVDNEWGCLGDLLGADETDLGTGGINTNTIFFECDDIFFAAENCYNLEFGGYGDWYLPAMDELHLLYHNLHANGLGTFDNEIYWSSTEVSAKYARYFDFDNGDTSISFSRDCRKPSSCCSGFLATCTELREVFIYLTI